MVEIDPTEHEIADLGPTVNGVDDLDELEAMLELEREATVVSPDDADGMDAVVDELAPFAGGD